MDLSPYDWSIGISDIKGWRECPARFARGMLRHVELPPHLQLRPGERAEPPGHTNWTNAYGSAIHHAIHLVDAEGYGHKRAVEAAMSEYGPWLAPADVALLFDDLQTFEARRPLGVTLVAAEADMRVPLFVTDEGQQIFFRFKLDVLYRLINNPSVFLHRDYKSTRWPKTQQEVHSDEQLWAYNFAIHEHYPECERLLQTWDGLKFGEISTSKNDAQRAQVKLWLIENVKAIMADDVYRPKLNDFCRYCELAVPCRETKRATTFWRGKLALTAPLVKDGRKTRVALADDGDEVERIIQEDLPEMQRVRKHIEHVEKELKEVIRELPDEDRQRLGWALQSRTSKRMPAEGLRELHAMLGDLFYELVSLPQTAIDSYFGKPKKGEPLSDELRIIKDWILTEDREPNVIPAKSGEVVG